MPPPGGSTYTPSVESGVEEVPNCGVCGEDIPAAGALACAACSSPHHADCWRFLGGCSVFACGGKDAVDFASRAATLRTEGLAIAETTRPPLRIGPVVTGLGRRFRSRLPFLLRTVPAGLAGALVSVVIGKAFEADPLRKAEVVAAVLLAGGIYGALAPFLASLQLRRPRGLAALSFLVATATFWFLDTARIRGDAALPFFLVIFVGALVFASSLAEWIAGYRTALGELLGDLGPWVRGGIAWAAVAAVIVCLGWIDHGRIEFEGELFLIAITMGLMGCGVAVPATEQGKKSFLAAIGSDRALPGA